MSSAVLTQDRNPELMTVFLCQLLAFKYQVSSVSSIQNNIQELIVKPTTHNHLYTFPTDFTFSISYSPQTSHI